MRLFCPHSNADLVVCVTPVQSNAPKKKKNENGVQFCDGVTETMFAIWFAKTWIVVVKIYSVHLFIINKVFFEYKCELNHVISHPEHNYIIIT